MKRIVFTFGTLYEPQIIKALLGMEPVNYLAVLKGYAVFQGTGKDLTSDIKTDIGNKHDLNTFTFLFAKKVENEESLIQGKAYEISTHQELILDWWERYPKWYRKEDVKIHDLQGNTQGAFIYTVDREGKKLDKFARVQGDISVYLNGAKNLLQKINTEFPNLNLSE